MLNINFVQLNESMLLPLDFNVLFFNYTYFNLLFRVPSTGDFLLFFMIFSYLNF